MSEQSPDSSPGERYKTQEEQEAEAMLAITDRAKQLYIFEEHVSDVTVESGAAPLGPDGRGISDLGMPLRFVPIGNFSPSDDDLTHNASAITRALYNRDKNVTVELRFGITGHEKEPEMGKSDDERGILSDVAQEYQTSIVGADLAQPPANTPEIFEGTTFTIEATVFDGCVPPTTDEEFGNRQYFGSCVLDNPEKRRRGSFRVTIQQGGQAPWVVADVARDADVAAAWPSLELWTDPSKLEVLSPGDTLPELTS